MPAAKNLATFEEFARLAPPGELVERKEVIVDAVLFAGARRASCGRNAQSQAVGIAREKAAQDSRFADSRWT